MGIFGWNTDKKAVAREWVEKGKTARDQVEKLRCFDRALKADPENARAWHQKGKALDYSGNYHDALACFDRALEIRPDYPYAWNGKGNTLRKLRRFAEAIPCYDQAIALKKDYPYPWNGKGDALLALGQYALAGKCYDRALKRKKIAWAWNGKGRVYLSFHDEKKAIECFDRAIELKPTFIWAWLGKGNALCTLGRYTKGIACFTTALKIQPDFREAQEAKATAEQHRARVIDAHTPVRPLLSALSDDTPEVRMRAAQEISRRAKMGAARDIVREGGAGALLAGSETDNPELKKYILQALGDLADNGFAAEIADPHVSSTIIGGLNDPAPDVRSASAWAIAVLSWNGYAARFTGGDAVPLLVQCLTDRNEVVRECSAMALDKIAYYGEDASVVRARAVPALLSCLYDSSQAVQNRALWALWSLSVRGRGREILDEDAARPLLHGLQNRDDDVRRAALCTVGEIVAGSEGREYPGDDEVEFIVRSLHSGNGYVRGAAAWTLGQCARHRPDPTSSLGDARQRIRAMIGDSSTYPVYNHRTERWEERTLDIIAREVLEYLFDDPPRRKPRCSSKMSSDFPESLNALYASPEYLGKGGFARVYRARKTDGTEVALKVPIDLDPATGRSFIAEIQNWTRLRHPNIVRVLDCTIMPVPFFELELCESSLDHVPIPMDPEKAAALVFEICEGLGHAHAQGIIHLDLKPRNILFRDGVPKISDWGLSRVCTASSTREAGRTTASCAAPEQITDGAETKATDIWQVGVILYELLVGVPPFQGMNLTEIRRQVLHTNPSPPSAVNPEIRDFDAVVMRCLEKDPADRYQSAAALQKDLAAYLQIRYSHSLSRSINDGDRRRSAGYCGDLVLVNLRVGDIATAYLYASDLAHYADGEIHTLATELADQIGIRAENNLGGVPEEILKKAEFVVHKVGCGFARM